MKKTKYLLILSFILCFSILAIAQQPFAPAWHPAKAKSFDPLNPGLTDPDFKFNKSSVPLHARFVDKTVKANVQQFWDSQVSNCLTWHMSCGSVPSQDALNFVGYNYNYWQYLDINIWWGGSAGEGIILPPSAPVIDASHLNGVKVLGQVFFPPTAFGGNPDWTDQILEKDALGEYVMAKKLVDIARFYGFDGWFINEETKVAMGGSDNAKWEGWVKTFNKYKDPNMAIQVYTMGTAVSPITNIWKQADVSFFVNYYATGSADANNTTYAIPNGVNHFDKFHYGIEIGGGGLAQGGNFRNLCGTTRNIGSFDLFCPERQTWQSVVDGIRDSEAGTGQAAYTAWDEVKKNESRFYVNINDDVTDLSQYSGNSWPGMANGVAERTNIMTKPFVTTFGVGNGKKRVVNGVVKGVHDWYHRGMQEVLPTWRWWIAGPKTTTGTGTNTRIVYNLKPDFTYDDVYNGGSALQFKGILTAGSDNLVRLYKTQLAIESGDKFQLIYKTSVTGTSCIEAKLAFSDNNTSFTTVTIPAATTNDWTTYNLDLTPYAGKTLSIIGFNFKSATAITNYSATFGQMSITPASFAPTCSNVTNLAIENELKETSGDLRITWNKATGDVHHYNVYMNRLGTNSLVGQTRNEGFYYPKFERSNVSEKSVTITVVPVKSDMTENGAGASITKNFPELGLPVVSISANKTIVGKNVNVTFTATATSFPETYSWSFPASSGAVMVSENASKNVVTYKFANDGKVSVTCNVGNGNGTTTKTIDDLVLVSSTVTVEKLSCAPNAVIHSSSGAINTTEVEANIIDCDTDGASTSGKWCNGGLYEHWVIIDLKSAFKVCKFVQYDSGVREDAAWNHKAYRIYTSNDLTNWTLVVDQKGRPENVKEDWCQPTIARYVKLCPYSEEEKITIRLYEFEIWGLEGTLTMGSLANATLGRSETKHFQTTFNLGGAAVESNFAVTVTDKTAKNLLQISNVVVSKENATIDFDLTSSVDGYDNVGSDIEVKLTNGDWFVSKTTKVKVLPNVSNVLLKHSVWASSNYSETYSFDKLTDGILTATNFWRSGTTLVKSIDGTSDVHILLFDLSKPQDFYRFTTKYYSASATYIPKKIGLYTTDEAINIADLTTEKLNAYTWTRLADITPSVSAASQEFIYENSLKSGRFLRMDLFGGGTNYRINEIEGYGLESVPSGIRPNTSDDESFQLYPTIVKSGDYFSVKTNTLSTLKIMSLSGVTQKIHQIKEGLTNIPTQGLKSGMYLILIEKPDHTTLTLKFLVK